MADTRAVSVQITNVLALAIITVLAGGLLFVSGEIYETQREQAAEQKVTSLGTDIQTAVTDIQRIQLSAIEANTTAVVSVSDTAQADSWDVRLTEDIPGQTVASAGVIIELNNNPETRQVFPVSVAEITESTVSNRDIRVILRNGVLTLEPVV